MSSLPAWIDALAALLVLVGASFALIGAIGLVRLPDVLQRLHAPSKASTLGAGCVLLATALVFGWHDGRGGVALLVALLLMLTAPVSAHLLAQAALARDPALGPARDDAPARADPEPPAR